MDSNLFVLKCPFFNLIVNYYLNQFSFSHLWITLSLFSAINPWMSPLDSFNLILSRSFNIILFESKSKYSAGKRKMQVFRVKLKIVYTPYTAVHAKYTTYIYTVYNHENGSKALLKFQFLWCIITGQKPYLLANFFGNLISLRSIIKK